MERTSCTKMNSRCIKDLNGKEKKLSQMGEGFYSMTQYSEPIKENINEIDFQFLKLLHRKIINKVKYDKLGTFYSVG